MQKQFKSSRNKWLLPTIIGGAAAMLLFSNDDIIKIAQSFVGKKELTNNSGFQDPEFEKAMKDVGWKKYNSWCVFFVKLVWMKALKDVAVRDAAEKLIVGNSQKTLANFEKDKSGYFTVSDRPTTGAIVIFQNFVNGKGQTSGHAGIVTAYNEEFYETIEGNTNSTGGREGYEVARKKRKYNRTVNNGLRLRKFITIKY